MRKGSPGAVDEVAGVVSAVLNAPDLPLDHKMGLVAGVRASSPELSATLDRLLIDECARRARATTDLRAEHERLRHGMDRLSAPPRYPAVYLGAADGQRGPGALVLVDGGRRVVSVAPEVDAANLQLGESVLVGPERNVIVGRAPRLADATGETAVFVHYLPEERLLVRAQDREYVVRAAGCLGDSLRPGTVLRWDRASALAYERVEASAAEGRLEDTPAETFAQIGGLAPQVARLLDAVTLRLDHPDVAARYDVKLPTNALLVGPPGVGKTLLSRAFANWLATRSASRRSRFLDVRPGEMLSKWYGESEERVRETFDLARRAAASEPEVPLVLFFDEIDALGVARGEWGQRYNDQVLATFLAELSRVTPESGVFVLAATNRIEALDPALTRPGGRLGDLVIRIPRPNRRAGRDILSKYLHAGLRYHADAGDGDGADLGRRTVIDAALSAIYAPNGHGPLAHVTLRDGTWRVVGAPDLVSGAVLAAVARSACARACRREVRTGRAGIRTDDALAAVDEQFAALAATLTPANVRGHVDGLPQDLDPVRVEVVPRRVDPSGYLMTA